MTRVIIVAAGDATRWKNYMGVAKHFVEVDGEPILHRTVRQLSKYPDVEVIIVGLDDRYRIEGAELFIPKKNPDNGDMDKFLNSRELWLKKGRTIILYGDVYFTNEAINRIITHDVDSFYLFARPINSYLSQSGAECFAISFYNADPMLYEAMQNCKKLFKDNVITRMGGWEVYRAYIGIPDDMMDMHLVTSRCFDAINDWTNDFDYPEDYDRFLKRRRELS